MLLRIDKYVSTDPVENGVKIFVKIDGTTKFEIKFEKILKCALHRYSGVKCSFYQIFTITWVQNGKSSPTVPEDA